MLSSLDDFCGLAFHPGPDRRSRLEGGKLSLRLYAGLGVEEAQPVDPTKDRSAASHQGAPASLAYGAYARHCWPRSALHPGAETGAVSPERTGSATLDGCPASWPIW